jgi:hypothetical protein
MKYCALLKVYQVMLTKQQNSSEEGFTLLETSVASMVMLVGLMGVMQLFVISALYNNSSRQTTVASMVAKRVMEQLLAAPFPTAEVAPLGYTVATQQLGAANAIAGYSKNFYIRYRDPNGGNGAMEIAEVPFVTSQPVDYVATWIVRPDNIPQVDGSGNPIAGTSVYPNMRIITVRVEATKAALKGNGARGANGPRVETATLCTIRTPANS